MNHPAVHELYFQRCLPKMSPGIPCAIRIARMARRCQVTTYKVHYLTVSFGADIAEIQVILKNHANPHAE